MYVFTRKHMQSIVIQTKDGPITIRVLDAGRGRVKLGIEAPLSCGLIRETEIKRLD